MKRAYLLIALLAQSLCLFGQDILEWNPEYKLQLSDFKSGANQTGANIISINAACRIDFAYQMSNYEFMFTKNFNSKIAATFTPSVSYYISPDKESLVALLSFGQLTFDLSELYARKLRQKIFEEKNTFSNAGFFNPIYQEIQKEMAERQADLATKTDIGRSKEKLQEEHKLILDEINSLSDFCKSCKPKKKKK